MKKTLPIIIIIAIVLIIAAGIVCYKLGFTVGKKSLEPTVAQYKKIIDYYLPVTEDMFNLSGKITEIEGNVLSVEITIQDPYKLPEEQTSEIRKIIITDATKITKFDMDTGENIEINLSTLEIDDQVYVGANEDIKDKSEFEAEFIELIIAPPISELSPGEILEPIEPK